MIGLDRPGQKGATKEHRRQRSAPSIYDPSYLFPGPDVMCDRRAVIPTVARAMRITWAAPGIESLGRSARYESARVQNAAGCLSSCKVAAETIYAAGAVGPRRGWWEWVFM